MKVLILGVDGMIGHKIAQSLDQYFDIFGTTRKKINNSKIGIKNGKIIVHDILINNSEALLNKIHPDILINCVGITTRRGVDKSLKNTEFINSHLPHYLDGWTNKNNSKLIHFSTDCVFNGSIGNYTDDSIPDATDSYGISKANGEIANRSTLTIRCSMIGRELYNFTELFEWLYSMNGKSIEGYSNVMYSGTTTVRMGKIIKLILENHRAISGILNISSQPISKFDLLNKLSKSFQLKVDIVKNPNIISNKVLISKKFTEITGISSPNWDDLIVEFKNDSDKNHGLYKKNILWKLR